VLLLGVDEASSYFLIDCCRLIIGKIAFGGDGHALSKHGVFCERVSVSVGEDLSRCPTSKYLVDLHSSMKFGCDFTNSLYYVEFIAHKIADTGNIISVSGNYFWWCQ